MLVAGRKSIPTVFNGAQLYKKYLYAILKQIRNIFSNNPVF